MSVLTLTEISSGYHAPQPAIDKVSLSVESGSIVALMGPNGAGKTTTLAAVSGLLRLWSGRIELDGKRIDRGSPAEVVQAGLAQVPEGRRILPGLTVQENLSMGAYTIRSRKLVAELQDKMMTLFPVLKQKLKSPGGLLSGGEQEMLAIARALMSNPKILLLDEPSMGLAPLVVQRIFEYLVALKKDGLGILLVEQNATMALRIASFAYILERGQVVASGEPETLARDEGIRRAYLGA
ncbi:MAG TPA: ABC transporter ATP-binding protein [Hypericibacter adhaerens]|jgi:branched-chain amino acid transport system ATP-binding protein|uniref:ABC transporter ATP-binding protein n=1 Tax=Hypericibacter adhaerens TaxID=2602016 RepID=A0A5J6MXY9_9PROT|nr:ABC transporter ATP-binding protein [Hypericibacter adhaerens]QEX21110.1 ABC transporter ATP-binding protein [Hypericibacter adhaerens]HWA44151.1 ABC transporter ATP-binding protein [Hypericibacter adhaerens]